MVSENNYLNTSGLILPDETLQGGATYAKVMLCGASGTAMIPIQVNGEGAVYFVATGSQAGV